jgi:hypothetical protein
VTQPAPDPNAIVAALRVRSSTGQRRLRAGFQFGDAPRVVEVTAAQLQEIQADAALQVSPVPPPAPDLAAENAALRAQVADLQARLARVEADAAPAPAPPKGKK